MLQQRKRTHQPRIMPSSEIRPTESYHPAVYTFKDPDTAEIKTINATSKSLSKICAESGLWKFERNLTDKEIPLKVADHYNPNSVKKETLRKSLAENRDRMASAAAQKGDNEGIIAAYQKYREGVNNLETIDFDTL